MVSCCCVTSHPKRRGWNNWCPSLCAPGMRQGCGDPARDEVSLKAGWGGSAPMLPWRPAAFCPLLPVAEAASGPCPESPPAMAACSLQVARMESHGSVRRSHGLWDANHGSDISLLLLCSAPQSKEGDSEGRRAGAGLARTARLPARGPLGASGSSSVSLFLAGAWRGCWAHDLLALLPPEAHGGVLLLNRPPVSSCRGGRLSRQTASFAKQWPMTQRGAGEPLAPAGPRSVG